MNVHAISSTTMIHDEFSSLYTDVIGCAVNFEYFQMTYRTFRLRTFLDKLEPNISRENTMNLQMSHQSAPAGRKNIFAENATWNWPSTIASGVDQCARSHKCIQPLFYALAAFLRVGGGGA